MIYDLHYCIVYFKALGEFFGTEMIFEIRPFEPDPDNSGVGKRLA